MSWVYLDKDIEFLNVSDVQYAYEDCKYIAQALSDLGVSGVSVGEITNPDAKMKSRIYEIQDILRTVEADLDEINSGTYSGSNVVSAYYGTANTVNVKFTKDDYVRWVNILDDLYDVVENNKGIWNVLELSDCIPTINDKEILMRGEKLA